MRSQAMVRAVGSSCTRFPRESPHERTSVIHPSKRIATAVAAVGALTSLNDDLRTGFNPDYWPIFIAWVDRAIAMGIISIISGVFLRFTGAVLVQLAALAVIMKDCD